MGYDSLLELITEPALIISTSSGLKRNSAWRAVLCEETPTLEGLASFLHCPQLCNIIEECLSRGDERLVDVLVGGGRAQMKIIVLDKQTICCAMTSKQSKQYSQLYAARSSTVGVVIDFADTTRPTICWTNKPSIPPLLQSHLLRIAVQGLQLRESECSPEIATTMEHPEGTACVTYRTKLLRVGATTVMALADDVSEMSDARHVLNGQLHQTIRAAAEKEANVWRPFFLNSPVMMAIVEPSANDDFKFISINTAMQAVLRNANANIGVGDATKPTAASELRFSAEDLKLFAGHLRRTVAVNIPVQFDYEWPRHFAPQRPNFYTSCWVNPLSSNRVALVCKDVSERIMADQRLRAHEKELETLVVARTQQLEAALAVKSRFLATMSHEIRTPLSGIIGCLTLLGDSPMSLEQKDLVGLAQLCGEQLLLLINDILDHTRLAEAKVKLEIAPLYIESVMEEVLAMMAYPAEGKAIELICAIDPGTLTSIMGDAHRIRQVLLNLMSNAVKFTSVGHVMLRVSSRLMLDNRVELLFTVADTGTGIDPDIARNLFQPFTQGDSSMSRRYGGSGLGLYISRSIAGLMEGSVWFESIPGKGSTFFFSLVASQAPMVQEPGYVVVPPGKHLWLCVQNDVLREALEARFRSWDFIVRSFASMESVTMHLNASPLFNVTSCVAVVDLAFPADQIFTFSCRLQTVLMGVSRRAVPPELQHLPFAKKPIFCQAVRRLLVDLLNPQLPKEAVNAPSRLPASVESPLEILVADDQPTNQMILRKLLATLGYQRLRFVDNGKQAVEAVSENRYDVVLMDVMMPEMNGVDATIAIRQTKPDIPIIFAITANAFTEDQEKCIAAGMDGVLTKPIRLGELQTALDKAVKEVAKRKQLIRSAEQLLPLPPPLPPLAPASPPLTIEPTEPVEREKRRRVTNEALGE